MRAETNQNYNLNFAKAPRLATAIRVNQLKVKLKLNVNRMDVPDLDHLEVLAHAREDHLLKCDHLLTGWRFTERAIT